MSNYDDTVRLVIDVPVVCVGEAVDREELENLINSHLKKAIVATMNSLRGRFKARASYNVNVYGTIEAGSVKAFAVRRGSYDDKILSESLDPKPKSVKPECIDLTGFCDGGDAQ